MDSKGASLSFPAMLAAALFCVTPLAAQQHCGAPLTAQQEAVKLFCLDGLLSTGIALEMNQYTDKAAFAMGEMIRADYAFRFDMAAGARVLLSETFGEYFNISPAAFFRWYPLAFGPVLMFAQAETGAAIILSDGWSTSAFDGGAGLGIYLPLGLFYTEAYTRFCYPGGFTLGIAGGVRIKTRKQNCVLQEAPMRGLK